MGLNLDPIDFLGAMQTWIVLHVIVKVARLFYFFGEDRWMELVLATIELYI